MLGLLIVLQMTTSLLVNTNYLTTKAPETKQSFIKQSVQDDRKLISDIKHLIDLLKKNDKKLEVVSNPGMQHTVDGKSIQGDD